MLPLLRLRRDGTNRRENITDWALEQFRTHYSDKKISKWDIFHYVYGVLHHPRYREKFADNLKRELPRIPFAPDFRGVRRGRAQAGRAPPELRERSREIPAAVDRSARDAPLSLAGREDEAEQGQDRARRQRIR